MCPITDTFIGTFTFEYNWIISAFRANMYIPKAKEVQKMRKEKNLWHEGTIGIPKKEGGSKVAHYWVKAYDEGSEYGINGGKISKLTLKIDGELVANYDRGWDVEPDENDHDVMVAYYILLQNYN